MLLPEYQEVNKAVRFVVLQKSKEVKDFCREVCLPPASSISVYIQSTRVYGTRAVLPIDAHSLSMQDLPLPAFADSDQDEIGDYNKAGCGLYLLRPVTA